jgi:hypothetical protein
MYAVDVHAHTRFFHGFDDLGRRFDPIGSRLLGLVARERGLDAVVTTNHDYYRELPSVEGVTLLPGIEVTTTRGHVLIVGPDPPARTEAGELTPSAAVDLAHERDCAAIIAHPFRNSTVRASGAAFDAIEVNGKGTESYDWVRRLADERDLPLVGGSDAHYPVEVGRAFTAVGDSSAEANEATAGAPDPEHLVDAIREGEVRAYVDNRPSQRLFRAGYRLTHGWKGWLDRPDWDPPGMGTPPGESDDAA